MSGRVSDYTYDSLYRLTNEVISDSVNGNYSASYVFDKVGNRTESTINGVTTAYTYDDNGNTLSKTIDSDITTYTYDARNKLIAAEVLESGVTKNLNYRYNVDGIRNQKVEDGVVTHFLVDSNRDYAQVIAETDSTNTVAVEYIFGDDLLAQNRSGSLSNYHYDGLGSTRALSDSTGNVSDEYFYDAFGVELARTGSTENDYLFTGEQYDAGLGNYYLRARYYDQGVGRFTQLDTFQGWNDDPVTLHKYLYANADPVSYIDPTGNVGMSDVLATLRIQAVGARAAVSGGRATIQRALVGKASREAFGIVGEEIIQLAKHSLLQVLLSETKFANAATKGTAAHAQFERLIKGINEKYKKYGLRVTAEVFRDKDTGHNRKRRAKGSIGVDVAVISTRTGKTLLAFDLKTGKSGFSKRRAGKLTGAFGSPVVEIFVSKK